MDAKKINLSQKRLLAASKLGQITEFKPKKIKIATGSSRDPARSKGPSTDVDIEFPNISAGIVPFYENENFISTKDAIELSVKAYFNVAVYKNTIDIMTEFCNSNIYWYGGHARSREFFKKWAEKINIWSMGEKYFLERYRSGNIFFLKYEANVKDEDIQKLTPFYDQINKSEVKIPIKYEILNPIDIWVHGSTNYISPNYYKIYNDFEIKSLLADKKNNGELWQSLDEETKKAINEIKESSYQQVSIQVALDPARICASFYKKQDYEPMSIPPLYPVLNDLEFKMELKRVDKILIRSMENIILLITMGTELKDGELWISQENIEAVEEIFENEEVSRVLVSDFTTNAKFIVPDVEKILGPEKYKAINDDIKEGLMNIFIGDDKYSNANVKVRAFTERLTEGQDAFLKDIIIPEVKRIGKMLGFKKIPTPKFAPIDISDKSNVSRIALRLLELGVLTPEETYETLNDGVFPDKESSIESQKQFLALYERGLYRPLLNRKESGEDSDSDSTNSIPDRAGRPGGTTKKQEVTRKQREIGASENISVADMKSVILAYEELKSKIRSEYKELNNIVRMSKANEQRVESIVKLIIESSEVENWKNYSPNNLPDINTDIALQISNIQSEKNISNHLACLIYHSKNKTNNEENLDN